MAYLAGFHLPEITEKLELRFLGYFLSTTRGSRKSIPRGRKPRLHPPPPPSLLPVGAIVGMAVGNPVGILVGVILGRGVGVGPE